MSIYTIKLIQEENDTPPVIKRQNIVIQTKYNGMKMMDDAIWTDWDKIFIFPDTTKAEYFQKHFVSSMRDFREGMLKDDYIFHIINCIYPEPESIYVDQLHMYKEFIYNL